MSEVAFILNVVFKNDKCLTVVRSEFGSLSFFFFVLADFAPDELEVGVREHILQDLEMFVRRQFAGEVNHQVHC